MRFRTLSHVAALALLSTAMLSAQGRQTPPPAPLAHNLAVTVKYTGKGVVDPSHGILVFLFDSPNFQASQPFSIQTITKNGDVASFMNLAQTKVYVVAIYDDQGGYTGRAGPPREGAPIGYYGATPAANAPAAVTVGAKTDITLTFDGSTKFSTGRRGRSGR
jgi:hypothetical protein